MTQNSEFGDHISNRFNQDLEELRNNVLKMGGLVENQLNKAIVYAVDVALKNLKFGFGLGSRNSHQVRGLLCFDDVPPNPESLCELLEVGKDSKTPIDPVMVCLPAKT